MFVAHEMTLGVGFGRAQTRLANLVQGNVLSGASQAAYKAGLASVIRVGPFGEMPGASKLVRVRFLDPVYHAEAMSVGFRWEATGVTGGLFPALDADISLTPDGAQTTRLALAGCYRPPRGHGDNSRPAAKRPRWSCQPPDEPSGAGCSRPMNHRMFFMEGRNQLKGLARPDPTKRAC